MRSPIFSNSINAVGTALWGTPFPASAPSPGNLILPLDYIQLAFGVSLWGILSQDASGITYSWLATLDDFSPDALVPCGISQTTTTITVTDPNLQVTGGVAVGDIVRIANVGATVNGQYLVASTPSTTTYTVTSQISQSFTGTGSHQYFRLFATPTAATGASTRIFSPLSHSTTGPATGVCLKVTARTAGSMVGVVVQGAGPG